jgi:enolase
MNSNVPVTIHRLSALEILDSRGRPTVKALCELENGAIASASVPSGASTGRAEAVELRDGDPSRYGGLGCRRAVAHVNGEISSALAGRSFGVQRELDDALIALDAGPAHRRLGANALLAVSIAFARASARSAGVPLFEHFNRMLEPPAARPSEPPRLPRPMINLFSGGKHAGGQTALQDVMVIPMRSETISSALETVWSVYRAASDLSLRRYRSRELVADEGGLAPDFPSEEAMLETAVASIEAAGLRPGADVALALDVAASHFSTDGRYQLGGRSLGGSAMIDWLKHLAGRYPIVALEDGLAEEDWPHWQQLMQELGSRLAIIGDDLLCTQERRIRRAVAESSANGLLLKVNQVGTLSESADALSLARAAQWTVIVSARSGETEDDWLADLATGWCGDSIKVGSITRSERLAKYNRLLEIESQTGRPLSHWPEH